MAASTDHTIVLPKGIFRIQILLCVYNSQEDFIEFFFSVVCIVRRMASFFGYSSYLRYPIKTATALNWTECFSHVWLFATVWTVAHQAPPSMGFSRQDYWSGLPFSPAGDLPELGFEPVSFASPAIAGPFFTTTTTEEALSTLMFFLKHYWASLMVQWV